MTNQELVQLFREINKHENCFDREIALKQAKKRYKKSQFYKQTHYSIQRAYLIFNFNGLHTLSTLLNSKTFNDLARGDIASLQAGIETFIETFDMTAFNNVFASIGEKLSSMSGDATELTATLQNILQGFQSNLN